MRKGGRVDINLPSIVLSLKIPGLCIIPQHNIIYLPHRTIDIFPRIVLLKASSNPADVNRFGRHTLWIINDFLCLVV